MRVGSEPVRSVAQLKTRIEKLRALNKNKIPLLILRNDAEQYIALVIGSKAAK
jgi:hypothetical protein